MYMKKSKYNNTKVEYNGIKFDSIKEKSRYIVLKDREKHGEIKDLKLQVPFILQPSYKIDGKTIREIKYIADFVYMQKVDSDIPSWKQIIEDVKASATYQTDVYKLKKKIFEYKYQVKIKEIY